MWSGENRPGASVAGSGILGHAFFHPPKLFGGRGDVIARLPFGGRHTVDDRAAGFLVDAARFGDPVAEAVAAESGKPHQVDVRGVVTMPEQADEAAKGGGGDGIVERVERIRSVAPILAARHGFISFTELNSYTAVALAGATRHATLTVTANRQAEQSWSRVFPPASARCAFWRRSALRVPIRR